MQAATDNLAVDSPIRTRSSVGAGEPWSTAEVLEELLVESIRLRDMYKNARWQSADIQFRRLRPLFDLHYQQQIQLVDLLIDRMRALNGANRVFAGDFLHPSPFTQMFRGRASVTQLLAELVDAHESVLNAAFPTGAAEDPASRSWTRDFAVGQVLLTNDEQVLAVREQLINRKRLLRSQPALD